MGDVIRWLPGGLRSAGADRARWGLVDQGFSSLTNFGLAAAVAHQATPHEFGSFSIALAVYIFVLWLTRSLVGEPFVLRMTEATPLSRTAAGRQALGAAIVIGALAGVAMVGVGALLETSGGSLTVMAVFMPGLLAQDSYRYVLMATGRVRDAAANDGIWFGVQVALFTLLLQVGQANSVGLTAAFGASATTAGVYGWRQVRSAPSPASWRVWLRAHRDLGIPFVLELITVNGATQLSMLGVAALGGVIAAGELRAAALLLGPPTVLCSGLYLIAVPEAVRLRHRSRHRLTLLVGILAVSMSIFILLWTVLLLMVPASIGVALLSSNWAHGRHVLIPMAAMTAANAAVIAALVGLRALEAVRQSLRVRIWAGPVILASGVIGAAVGDGFGAATGLALSSWLGAFLAFIVFRRALEAETSAVACRWPLTGESGAVPMPKGAT